jgi:hypothetical protein
MKTLANNLGDFILTSNGCAIYRGAEIDSCRCARQPKLNKSIVQTKPISYTVNRLKFCFWS